MKPMVQSLHMHLYTFSAVSKIRPYRISENIFKAITVCNVIVEQSEILLNVKISLLFDRKRKISVPLAHLLPFVNQCWIGKNGHTNDQDEELLAGVTSYFK